MNDTIEAQGASPLSRAANNALQRRRATGLALVDKTEAIVRVCRDIARYLEIRET